MVVRLTKTAIEAVWEWALYRLALLRRPRRRFPERDNEEDDP